MTPVHFVETLQALDFEDTFNPYADRCGVHDGPADLSGAHQTEAQERPKV